MDELAVFRNAVDALPYGVTLWQADSDKPADLRLIYANPQASREADLDLSRFVGRPLRELLPSTELEPGGRGKSLGHKGLEAALGKTTHRLPQYRVELRGQPRDFRVHMVPVWNRTVAMVYEQLEGAHQSPERSPRQQPQPRSDLGSQTRIYFEDIVRTFHEPLVVIDGEGLVLWANQVLLDLLEVRSEEIVDKPVGRLPGGGFSTPAFEELIGSVLPTQNRVTNFELTLELGDKPRTMLLNARRLHSPDDATRLVLLALRDVTEERSATALRRHFVQSVLEAREEERRSVARELHDQVGQSLELIAARLYRLPRQADSDDCRAVVDEVLENVRELTKDVARLAAGLHPLLLDQLGFGPAVRQLLDDLAAAHGLHVDVEMTGFENTADELEPALSLALYRMIQEGLTNVARHAKAANANVIVHRQPTRVRLIIEDDGDGIVASRKTPVDGSIPGRGLAGLRERTALLGGEMEIESAPGDGTTLVVTIPTA